MYIYSFNHVLQKNKPLQITLTCSLFLKNFRMDKNNDSINANRPYEIFWMLGYIVSGKEK